MTGLVGTIRALLARLARNWVPKLISVVIACLIWVFVTNSSATLTQRSLVVPLQVDGVADDLVPVGLPTSVAVSVSGPSLRVDRLTPDMIRASLDLTAVNGQFERPIVVQSPQDVRVLRVEPAEVIGFLESITSSTMAVTTALTGQPPGDAIVQASVEPASVTLTGRSQVLAEVTRVLAVAPVVGGGVARLVALDGSGLPVADVEFSPDTVTVSVGSRPALVTKEVPLELDPPQGPNLSSVTLSADTVTVAGPPDTLAELNSVSGTVDAPTGAVDAGRYTFRVRLDLPNGVAAMTTPTATLLYVRAPLQP